MPKTIVKNKISPKDLGKPASVTGLPEGQNRLVLGRIVGIASGLKTGLDNTGRPFMGLKGSFQAIPAKEGADIIRSGICYLPPGMVELVAEEIKGDDTSIKFAFEIAVVKAANPIGYSYECTPLIDVAASDPLSQLIVEVSNQTALTDQTTASTEVEKPKGGKRAAA